MLPAQSGPKLCFTFYSLRYCITTLLHYCITTLLQCYNSKLLHFYITILVHYCITTTLLHYYIDTFNHLITESEVVTGNSQTEALPYWPTNSEVNAAGRGLIFSRNDRTVEVIKLLIIWLTVWIKEKENYSSGSRQFTSGDAARLPIHSSFQTQGKTQ